MCITLNDIYLAIADSEAYVEMPPRPVYTKCKKKIWNSLFRNGKPVQYSYQEHQYVLLNKQSVSGEQRMTYEFSYRQYRGTDHCLTIKDENRKPVFVLTNGEANGIYTLLMARLGKNVNYIDTGIDREYFNLASLRYKNADPGVITVSRVALQRKYKPKSA